LCTGAAELRVEVGKQAALEERVVREVDAGHDVGRAEGDLLGLGEEVVGIAVEGELADAAQRHERLGPDLARVEGVERELVLVGVVDHLHRELVLGKGAALDGLPEIAAVEVSVLAGEFLRFVPDERVDAEHGLPVELDEAGLALSVDEAEGVDAEAVHHGEAARDGAVGEVPHDHVHRFGGEPDEVPKGVVGGGGLGGLVVGLGLHGVDEVGELDGVLDEEDGDVVADEVEDAVFGIELRREAAHVADSVGGAARAGDCGEAHEDGRPDRGVLQELGHRVGRHGLVDLEVAVGAGAAGVDDALGDTLVVEVGDLLAQDEVFEEGGAAVADLQRLLVVADAAALVGSKGLAVVAFAVGIEIALLTALIHEPLRLPVQRSAAGTAAGQTR
jgi:hypothetical protein